MNSIIGFSLLYKISSSKSELALRSQAQALRHFKHLHHQSISIGKSQLEVWGHRDLKERIHTLPDGSLAVLVGSPLGKTSLADIATALVDSERKNNFILPWDGRIVLLLISADGERWTMWNDWLGSIPVFHTQIEGGRIASTLEPVVVAAASFSTSDIFLPGLLSLLTNGHYISDWSLYQTMKVVPPDAVMHWGADGFHAKLLWTITPTQDHWETGWDDLIDEMHEKSRQAIAQVLNSQPEWVIPLSAGLDSRLIAAVGADLGITMRAYAWGAKSTTDVIYSRQIARALQIPWKHVNLPHAFLMKHTRQWAELFGSGMHFHGMYQMSFLDLIASEPNAPIASGFIGDVLAGDGINDLIPVHTLPETFELTTEWYLHWTVDRLRSVLKVPYADALQATADEYKKLVGSLPGPFFQKMIFLELWNRQRFFTCFQSTVADYYRGVANPFLNREYARFCLSLPRAALDNRRLLGDVFRRYYGPLAVIPGTYADQPYILTGRYLIMRRIAQMLHPAFHHGPLKGFVPMPLRMDIEAIQATGRESLWPIFEASHLLAEWLDMAQVENDFQTIMRSKDDVRPLRRLQSVQTLAYRLMES